MAPEPAPSPVKSSAGITALPPTTVQRIGATQVLVNPSSVVKELIDNALDARATAIFVNISANTISSIEVKDNGHGVAADDRPLICRRYCTSKIRDFDDVKQLGGKWLGFRGEAMASLAEMSGALTVTTRVEGDPVAATLRFCRDGTISSSERASHPVGTTVKVTDFFKSFPVRKQGALKHSSKWLAIIKRLMQAYALARPAVRLQLRVLKAKNDAGTFNYAPKAGARVEDAALKVFGKDCALQCEWTDMRADGLEIQAFLPQQTAAATKIANYGAFLSVDWRPINSGRGIGKKIIATFKEEFRQSSPGAATVNNPFCCMNIICPPNSYDPNIEPAKDDVLFEDEAIVLELVVKLLTSVYPATGSDAHRSPKIAPEDTVQLSPCLPASIYLEKGPGEKAPAEPQKSPSWNSSMYGIDEEHLCMLAEGALETEEVEEEDEGDHRAAAISNPWIIAKMNARIKSKTTLQEAQLLSPLNSQDDLMCHSSSPLPPNGEQTQRFTEPLTPAPSSQIGQEMQSKESVSNRIIGNMSPPGRPIFKHSQEPSAAGTPKRHDQRQTRPQFLGAVPRSPARDPDTITLPGLEPFWSSPTPSRRRDNQSIVIPQPALERSRPQAKTNQREPVQEQDLWFGQPMRGIPANVRNSCTSRARRNEAGQTGSRFTNARFKSVLPRAEPRQNQARALQAEDIESAPLYSENNTDIRDFLREPRQQRHESAASCTSSKPSQHQDLGSRSPSQPPNTNPESQRILSELASYAHALAPLKQALSTKSIKPSGHPMRSYSSPRSLNAVPTPTPPSPIPGPSRTRTLSTPLETPTNPAPTHLLLTLHSTFSTLTYLAHTFALHTTNPLPSYTSESPDPYPEQGILAVRLTREEARSWAVGIDGYLTDRWSGWCERFEGDGGDAVAGIEGGIWEMFGDGVGNREIVEGEEEAEEEVRVEEIKGEDEDEEMLFK